MPDRSAPPCLFEEAVEQFLAFMEPGGRAAGTRHSGGSRWRVARFLCCGRTVDGIGSSDNLEVLVLIWHSRPETAVCASACAWCCSGRGPQGHAASPNPVDVAAAAVSHPEVRRTLTQVFGHPAAAETRLSLAFLVLTAARSGEVRMSRWEEIGLAERVWTTPGERTKTGRPRRVPLSTGAVRMLLTPPLSPPSARAAVHRPGRWKAVGFHPFEADADTEDTRRAARLQIRLARPGF